QAHLPGGIMWARGFDDRAIQIEFVPPAVAGPEDWQVMSQLRPSDAPGRSKTALEYSAPNLQYLMDSPAEFGRVSVRSFTVGDRTFRFALHHTGTSAELDGLVKDVEKIVRQEGAIYGEYPAYEPGNYTFLADYLPHAYGDGMEHRNSTVITSSASIATARESLLDTVAHE